MSSHPSLVTLATVVTTGLVLAGHILLSSGAAWGGPNEWETSISPAAPANAPAQIPLNLVPGTTVEIAVPPPKLDEKDEIAALERIQYALVGGQRRQDLRLAPLARETVRPRTADRLIQRHQWESLPASDRSDDDRPDHQETRGCRLPAAERPLAARWLKQRFPFPHRLRRKAGRKAGLFLLHLPEGAHLDPTVHLCRMRPQRTGLLLGIERDP